MLAFTGPDYNKLASFEPTIQSKPSAWLVINFTHISWKNSIAFRASIVWNLLTPDLAKTSNVKNYTRMASKSDKLRNLDFQAECPQTMPHNNNDIFLYYYSLGFS